MTLLTDRTRRLFDREAAYLNKIHGYPPESPFRSYRLNLNYSHQELALHAGVNKVTVIRAEQALYTNPPNSLMSYFTEVTYLTYPQILEAYEHYQYKQRLRHFEYFGPHLNYSPISPEHPLRQLRYRKPLLFSLEPDSSEKPIYLEVGIKQLCRDLCIPSDVIEFFERKWRRQQSVPKILLSVLLKLGYTQAQVQDFSRDYKDWRELQLQSSKPRLTEEQVDSA